MAQPGDGKILPGMAGTATIRAKLPQSAGKTGISIPASAAFAGSDINVTNVWVIDPETQTVSRRDVELLDTTARGIFVRGLERGEWVAVSPTWTLREGQKVRLVEQEGRG